MECLQTTMRLRRSVVFQFVQRDMCETNLGSGSPGWEMPSITARYRGPGLFRAMSIRIGFAFLIYLIFSETPPIAAEQRIRRTDRSSEKSQFLRERHIELMEENIIRLTNEQRQKAKLEPLKISPALTFLARKQSKNMCIYTYGSLDHESKRFPEGWRKFSDRMKAGRISSAGENIAYSTSARNPEKWGDFMVNGWMNSPNHRKNILNRKFNYLGVAVWECSGNLTYATQVFSSDMGRIPSQQKSSSNR
jgi:uncharacterized protein YkwD